MTKVEAPFSPLSNEDRLRLYSDSEYERTRAARVRQLFGSAFSKGNRVVEIGAGLGLATDVLVEMGCEVTVVEPASDRVQSLRAKFGGNYGVRVIEDQFPVAGPQAFHSDSYDGVVALEVLEHVADPAAFLRECLRILKPGAKLVLSTPNRWSMESAVNLLRYGLGGQVWTGGDPTHLWLFSSSQTSKLLSEAKFTVTYREALQFGCGDQRGGKIPKLPVYFDHFKYSNRWPWNRLGYNLLFIAQRKLS